MAEVPGKLLSRLMVIGAQSPDKAVSSESLSKQFGMETGALEAEIKSLREQGYLEALTKEGTTCVYLSLTGIIAASSVYS
jgi:biotin operon repressor